jgi:hypothetical protein
LFLAKYFSPFSLLPSPFSLLYLYLPLSPALAAIFKFRAFDLLLRLDLPDVIAMAGFVWLG